MVERETKVSDPSFWPSMAAPTRKGSKSKSKAAAGSGGAGAGGGGTSGSLVGGLGLGSRDRGPPPSLFLHPSPQASHVSLPGIHGAGAGAITSSAPSTTTNTTAPGASTVATTNTGNTTGTTKGATRDANAGTTSPRDFASPTTASGTNPRRTGAAFIVPSIHNTPSISSLGSIPLRGARSADRTDALWAEMQATLEEVEFSATGSTHVFRPEHEKKLSELRSAQISLAQAWARSEADEDVNAPGPAGSADGMGGGEVRTLKGAMGSESGDAGADQANAPRPGSSGVGSKVVPTVERMGRMEEETEVDILLAKKRREANDRYFRRVNQGVIDVVSKLADVADAMRKVEAESKDIWGENENVSVGGK